ncbi:MAG: hypothetical protein AAB075_06835, partial [Gemmatimonadota bacterium]
SVPFDQRKALAALARRQRIPLFGAGRVGPPGEPLEIRGAADRVLRWDPAQLRAIYMSAIPRRMSHVATSGGEGD